MPSGDLATIIEKLSALSDRDHRVAGPAIDAVAIDYRATMDVFDVPDGGRVLVVWTGTFPVPDTRIEGWADIVAALRDAVFDDFVGELSSRVLLKSGAA